MSNPIARLRSRGLLREMAAFAPLYAAPEDPAVRARYQLEQLNLVWERTRCDVPYYAALAHERALPERWGSLEEFAARVPASGRASLQQSREAMTSTERPPDSWGATGGSTAQPVRIPRWDSEDAATRGNQWIGRGWQGVAPHDRLFLLWGHSHLLGTGLRGWWNARRRELDDRLMGYCRFSAYDLRDEAMRAAVAAVLRFRPAYIVGYSVALDRLERAAAPHRARLRALGIKAVIGTSERFPYPDSTQRIADTFGCRVAMEYGAVEAMGMAYTRPEGGYQLFWHSYLAEAERRGAYWTLRVTSLYPRSLPLVRYEIGDEVELADGAPDHVIGLSRFERLIGRCNDHVVLTNGTLVHSEVFSHAVRPCDSVRGYQILQEGTALRLRVTPPGALSAEEEAGLRGRLAKVDPELAAIALERVESLHQTVAGKTPMIVRR